MTTSARWQRIQELFETLETVDLPERTVYLEGAESDPAIRGEVLQLLESARLEEQATLQLKIPRAAPLPVRIAGFTILSTLGSGGFSNVYSALRRVNQMEQRVAVKLFHAHRLGPDAQRRFEREQKMLASLNHPAIVSFLDAGVTGDGQPYLVMEEVEGSPITEHCDVRRLGIDDRLRLVADACLALQHAHRRLIVHLDLKPSNILVTGDGQVKVLDFGTSKLMDETGVPTVTVQLTPLYASPERLRGEAGSVGSDVYSLGLVLAELLSGSWPFRDRDSIPAMANRAQGYQDARPLLTLATGEAAAARGTTVERLRKLLSGDLTAICSKALAHEPGERYGSMTELLDDIRRYQAGEPVLAHPPGFVYRTRKFIKRNGRMLALTAVASALLFGAAAYAWREHIRGVRRLEEARSMANYLLFDLYDRINDLPGSTAVRARMAEQAQSRLDGLAALSGADSEVRLEAAAGYNRLAEIQGISGSSSLGDTQAAAGNLERAQRLADRILAEQPGNRAALIQRANNSLLSAKLHNWNRRNTAAARPLIEQARRDLGQSSNWADPRWLRAWSSLAVQDADLAEFEQNFAQERRIAGAALADLDRWPAELRSGGDYLLRQVALLKRRGNADYYEKQYPQALASYRSAHQQLERFDALSPNRPEVLYSLMDMSYQIAYTLGELKQPTEMLNATIDSLHVGEKLIGFDPENQALRRSYWNKRQALAESLAALGRFDQALREQEAVLTARQGARTSQPDSSLSSEDVLVTQATFAGILAAAGKHDRACVVARQTLEASRAMHVSSGMTAKNWSEQQRMLDPILAGCAK